MRLILITTSIKKKNIYETILKSKLLDESYTIILLKNFKNYYIENEEYVYNNNNIIFVSAEIKYNNIDDILIEKSNLICFTLFTPFKVYLTNKRVNYFSYNSENKNVLDIIMKFYFPDYFIKNETLLTK